MIQIERSALMPYPPRVLLALVQDVASYPAFMPGCIGATVQEHDGPRMRAGLQFRFAGMTESFLTENLLIPGGSHHPDVLQMRLLRGPFKSLSGEWRFQSLGDSACKVSLGIELEWGALSLGRLLSPQMERAVSAVMLAFKQRADQCNDHADAH